MDTVNIIGAGLAGSITALVLGSHGIPTRVFDDGDAMAGSRASSNLFCASWLKKWGRHPGIAILEQLFPSARVEFPGLDVRLVRAADCLVEPDVPERVHQVTQEGVCANGGFYSGPTVICAGYRGEEFGLHPEIKVKTGHCLLFEGQIETPRLNLVSPFTHQKAFQYDDQHIYYADSVAVVDKNYWPRHKELVTRTKERCQRFTGLSGPCEVRVGRRPFIDGHPYGYVRRHGNIFIVNGGGKNGMVAYASAACKVREMLCKAL